jgi:glutaredoxin
MTILIELYTRPGCHLCEDAKRVILAASSKFDFHLCERNVEDSAEMESNYGEEIPVIFINGRQVFKHRITAAQLERYLTQLNNGNAD